LLLGLALVAAGALLPAATHAQSSLPSSEKPYDFYSRGPYAEGAPRPEQVLGYPIGTHHSYHHQMEAYMTALAQAPAVARRIKMEQYATSHEARRLWLIFISSEENITNLEEIRQRVARLKDPRATSEADARQIAAGTPAIAWLNFANDGNESAAFEAAMQVAFQLAAGEDAATRLIRERVVTIINPAHNPDAHDRFVTWFNAVSHAKSGNADPDAAEHDGDWLMDSNNNHYNIDLNRDAFAMTQLESQAIVPQIHRWNPQVFVDHHGNPPIFFFPPNASPVNPNYGESYARGEQMYGRAIAAEFDKHGWSYMNREVFDLFFPGYYDSYPSLTGAIGMTFETDGGGNQGLRLQRADGTISTLHAGTAKHFAGSMAVLEATAKNKEQRLVDFYMFRKTGMDDVEREPMKQIVFVAGSDPGRMASFMELLLNHGIEVYRASSAFSSVKAHRYEDPKTVTKQFPAGSYVVPLAQPQKRLLKTLLEPEAKLPEDFLKEVLARKERNDALGRSARKESYGFYDITAWSLPLTFGVEAYWTEDRAQGLTRVESVPAVEGGVEGGRAQYAYIFHYDSNASARLLGKLLQEDYRALVARAPVKIGPEASAETYDRGSILLRVERNPESLHQRIAELARECGVKVRAVNAAWTETGITLGSGRIQDLKRPRVAIATYEPTSGRAYGALWFLFERIFDYEFTPLRADRIRSVDLSKYDVLIFPDGSEGGYQEILGNAGVARVKQWIENGGVFIGIKGGAAFATRRGVEWTTSRLVGCEEPPAASGQAAGATAPAQRPAEPEKEVERTPGAILRADINLAHFLTLGYAAQDLVMHNSNYIFKPSRDGTHVVTYAKENPRVSGYIWPETEKRLAGSPYLIVETMGRGQVILFADDPTFRNTWPRLTRLLLNAVFFAPSLR
jgi:hypothetical protein